MGDTRMLSRRTLLRRAPVIAGGLLMVIGSQTAAIAKMAQKAAGYQNKPHDKQQCVSCALFKAPSSCTLVDGTISPDGWCRFYSRKTS